MAQRNRVAKAQKGDKKRVKPNPGVGVKPAKRQTKLIELSNNLFNIGQNNSFGVQAARLGDPRLSTVQRQALGTQIGQVQGNRHLQQVIASMPPKAGYRPLNHTVQRDDEADITFTVEEVEAADLKEAELILPAVAAILQGFMAEEEVAAFGTDEEQLAAQINGITHPSAHTQVPEAYQNALWDFYKAAQGFEESDEGWVKAPGQRRQFWANLGMKRISHLLDILARKKPEKQAEIQAKVRNPITEIMLQGTREVIAGQGVPAGKKAQGKAQKAAIVELATWCRNNLPNQAMLDAYLDRPDITDEEKMQTIGRLAVEVARMEFLLGWMHEGGVSDPDGSGWENKGADKGEFPTYYQEEMGKKGGGAWWCTRFTGYAYSKVGFNFNFTDQVNEQKRSSTAKGIFGSGYRLRTWLKTGKTVGKKAKTLTPEDETVANAATSGQLIDRGDWKALRKTMKKIKKKNKDAQARKEAYREEIRDFFGSRIQPQTGDILIIGGKNNNFVSGHSHTTMVEQYDESTTTILTVEGNAQAAVYAREIDLADPWTIGKIIFLARLGVEPFQEEEAETTATPATQGSGSANAVTADDLLNSIKDVNTDLVKMSHDQGWIMSDNPEAPVLEWINGKEAEQGEQETIDTQ